MREDREREEVRGGRDGARGGGDEGLDGEALHSSVGKLVLEEWVGEEDGKVGVAEDVERAGGGAGWEARCEFVQSGRRSGVGGRTELDGRE